MNSTYYKKYYIVHICVLTKEIYHHDLNIIMNDWILQPWYIVVCNNTDDKATQYTLIRFLFCSIIKVSLVVIFE